MADAATAKKPDARTQQFKRVRLSFADGIKEKKATVEDGKPKFTINVLMEADQPNFDENKKKAMTGIEAACLEKWKKADAWKAIAEDNKKRICFRKGTTFKNKTTGEVYAGYDNGNFAISCGTPSGGQKRPKLLDRHKREVSEADIEDIIYSGSYADVVISFYGTDKGDRGVFCTIEAIRSHQEGERTSSGVNVSADDFDDLDDGGDDLLGPAGDDDDLLG